MYRAIVKVLHLLKGTLEKFLLLAGLAIAQVPERTAVDQTIRELSAVTGFPARHPVSFQVLSRKQVHQFLDDRIKEAIKPEEIRAEELTLKKFGFVPPDFDLRKTTVALLTEQTAAFYDYHRKRLFLTDWTSARLREAATIHELAHALADQNYPLERFAKQAEHDSEQAAARQAVVEGQANWLMRDLMKGRPDLAATPGPAVDDGADSQVFDQAPLYLRETLTFPYNEGQNFQDAVYAKLGQAAFRRVFEQPPVSTQQILHPEMYFAGIVPVKITLPKLHKMRQLVGGPLGELDHAILLRQYTTGADAANVSPHLRGAMFGLWEQHKTKRVSLVYRSAWETDAWAAKYFELYKLVLRGKWKHVKVSQDSGTNFAGVSEDGYFAVDLAGTFVTSREGIETEA